MSEDEWFARDWPNAMFGVVSATPAGKDANRLRRFGCAVCSRLDWLLTDQLRDAIALAEAAANGTATDRQLRDRAQSLRELTSARALMGSRSRAVEAISHLLDGSTGAAAASARAAGAADGRPLDAECAGLLRCVFGNPFRPVRAELPDEWRTETVVALAHEMYESRDFGAMPVLGDALQDAGCDDDAVLSHCRDERTRGDERTVGTHQAIHNRGCWVVDLVLGKK
ncbi:MAG TPA: hypothetical protein VGE74_17860 [Gemmata sp.]